MIQCTCPYKTILSVLFLFLVVAPYNNALSHRRIKMKLIHIDSPESPIRMNYDSPEHRHKIWEEISNRRVSRLYHQVLPSVENPDEGYHPDLTIDPTGVFLASLGVGTPPVQQFLAMDTGSTIVWVTCIGSRYQPGNYNYNKSNTSSQVECGDYQCEHVPYNFCYEEPLSDPCRFEVSYASSDADVKVSGLIMTETFTFFEEAPQGENLTEPLITFGCGFPSGPIHDDFNGTGVMGLSNGLASLSSQLGNSFSYCIGNLYNKFYQYNTLILGEGNLVGNWTGILYTDNKIFVNLETITVGGEVLAIDPLIFQRNETAELGGTIIDSGATVTYLADEAYSVFRKILEEKMKPEISSSTQFCIEAATLRADPDPEVQLIFDQGATLTFGIKALFWPRGTFQCLLGIKPTSSALPYTPELTVIGINVQQFHNVGYDYQNTKMYIKQMSCEDSD